MPAWLSPYLAVPQPTASDLIWGVALWCLGGLGALTRINRNLPWWRPQALLLAAVHSAQLLLFLYLIFGLPGDLKAAGLRDVGLVVSWLLYGIFALAVLALIGRLFPRTAAALAQLGKRVEADIDKDSAGGNYPSRPLDFPRASG